MRTPFTTQDGGTVAAFNPWTVHFISEDGYEDWDVAGSEGALHAVYQGLGSPYVVTTYQQAETADENPEGWYQHPSLTVAERNPSLC